MLHEWRSRSCNHECNELSNFVKSSRWSSAWKPTSHQILTTIWWFRISDIRKFLIGILKFHGLGLWCFTLWCFVSHLPLPLSLLFTRKKNFLIFYIPMMHWDDYILLSDAWRLLFFCRLTIQATCICDNFNGAKSRNEMLRYYCYGTK